MPKFSAYMKGGDGSPGVPGASIIDGILSSSTELPDYPNHGKHAYLVGTSNPKHLWVWNEENNQWEDEGTTASQIGNITASATTIPWDSEPSVQTQFSTSNQIDSFNFDFSIPMGRPAGFGASTDIVATTTDWDGDITAAITTDGPDYAKNFHFDFKIPVGKPAGFGEISVTTESVPSGSQPWVSISTDEQSPDDAKGFNFAFGIPEGVAAGFSTGQHVTVSTLDTGEYATVEITTVTSSPETAKEFNFHFGLPRGDALAIYDGITFTSTEDGIDYHWENRNGTSTLIFNRGTVEKLPIYIYNNNNENIASTFKISTSTIEYEADEKFDGTMYLMMPATLQNIEIGSVSSTTYEYEPVVSKSTGSTSTDLILDFVIPKGGKNDEIYDVSSGKITNFIATDAPVGDLTVDIEPVQDLHGYDNPWPAGGGKNKFNWEDVNYSDFSISNGVFTNSIVDTRNFFQLNLQAYSNNAIVGSMGTVNCRSTGKYYITITEIPENTTKIKLKHNGSTRDIVLFYIPVDIVTTPFTISLTVVAYDPTTVGGLVISDIQIEEGSTATDYTPYSNICPISGWTGMTVQRTGKNLLNVTATTVTQDGLTFTVNSDKSITVTGTRTNSTNSSIQLGTLDVKKGQQLTISGSVVGYDPSTGAQIFCQSSKAFPVGHRLQSYNGNEITQNALEDETITCRLYIYTSEAINITFYPMIRFASNTDSTYEPYTGTTYPISWETEAGTVYGGSLDVTTGMLTVDRASVDLGTQTWSIIKADDSLHYRFYFTTSGNLAPKNVNTSDEISQTAKSSYFRIASGNEVYNHMYDNSLCIPRTGSTFYAYKSGITDPVLFTQEMSGVQLVYELATPITYQLTPTEITTLLGQNNIWADTGDNKILYFKNTEDGKSIGQILNNILTSKTNEAPLDDKAYTRLNGQWATNITSYGYCTTDAETAAKTVFIPNFQLVIGSTIFVKFQNANNASNPTLNVNNTGAKPIYRYGTTVAATSTDTNGWRAGSVLALTYDGTGWIEHYWFNTTYSLANNNLGSGHYIANSAIYRYQLLVHTDREHLSPFNNNNNVTATTKTILTNVEFDPFEQIYYYDSTTSVSANSLISGNALQYTKDNLDLRLVFNINDTTSPLTLHKDVYMKVTPLSNGKVKLASAMPLVQELPSTNDGYWYIFLGRATTRAYGLTLYPDKPVFYHDGTRIRQKFNPYIEKDFRCYHVTATIPQGTTKSFTVIGCTPTMRVINCVFGTPSNVTSNVQWTTTTDLVKFDGTFIGSTDVNFDLIESDTLTAVAI